MGYKFYMINFDEEEILGTNNAELMLAMRGQGWYVLETISDKLEGVTLEEAERDEFIEEEDEEEDEEDPDDESEDD